MKIIQTLILVMVIAGFVSAQTILLSEQMADTAMNREYIGSPNGTGIPAKWTYDFGVVLNGMRVLWFKTGDAKYFNFIKQNIQVDNFEIFRK